MNNDYTFDLESYPNIFTLAAKHHATGYRYLFEISHRRNDREALCQWLRYLSESKARMIGFNNVGFDWPVVDYILNTPDCTAASINRKVEEIIRSENKFGHLIWDPYVPQIDLYKIHHFDNKARQTSLKSLQFNMRSANLVDLPFPPGSWLTDEQIDQVLIPYNHHDVDETERFYVESADQIRFREELTAKYNRNFLNHNDTKIGKDYFIMELERVAPGSCYIPGSRTPRQTLRPVIHLRDVVFPWIQFRRPEFQRICDWFRAQSITETKGVFKDLSCVVDGFQFDFGTGGIHGSVSSRTVRSDEQYVVRDYDVSSYYPNLAISNRVYPEHLGERFCDIYRDVYEQRKQYKKGTAENAMLKLALNGVYGDSNNQYSPFYDPQYTMSITINGQLLLCLLAEMLMDIPGLEMIQINTDGLTVRCPRCYIWYMDQVATYWQTVTRLELESVEYPAMWIRDCNSYLALSDNGKMKRKGAYAHVFNPPKLDKGAGDLDWHQDHSALIIPKAAEAALVRGESIEAFIFKHTDDMDFMLRAKVPRSSRLYIGDQQVQNVTRYFVSKDGGAMVKVMPPLAKTPDRERPIGICVGRMVTECNDAARFDRSRVDYDYYIKETEKLVRPLIGG